MKKMFVGCFLGVGLLVVLLCCKERAEAQECHGLCVSRDAGQESVDESKNSPCPEGMVLIEGDYCNRLEEICLKYGDPDNKGANGPVQCLEFKYPTRCLSNTTRMRYCIDKYPYPNKPEEKPTTQLSWYQAKDACEADGKRLCTIKEFTQACRGPENKPYPYNNGYIRDCSKCNCDLPRYVDPAKATFAELDKRVPMNSMPDCVSDYGVYDLVGNNDRWVRNENGTSETKYPYVSALVGGHEYRGARARCSPYTDAHGPTFSWFETGAECCKDAE